ncbi:DNase I-like superfamily protein [Tripterygium wilfordii]|uniref:DNase I-like superfamily protein n=1 Tax=Tripterygium wilfordii TaxID=458696 RepID=A0A7J7CF68_TRIWF|nr:uncharacterized protein LOC119982087 [Tripterygium wilfordii]KAF5732732.1 DNase I-like superfamily protein [Tripterygium wilfordii]
MLRLLHKTLLRRLRWTIRRRSSPKVLIKKFGKSNCQHQNDHQSSTINGSSATVFPNNDHQQLSGLKSIRLATFNAALFSMAPAVPNKSKNLDYEEENDFGKADNVKLRAKSMNNHRCRPKSILKQSTLHPMNGTDNQNQNPTKQQKFAKSKLRVSINLPDNEISLLRGKAPMRRAASSVGFSRERQDVFGGDGDRFRSTRTVVEVLRELDADILALQDVKAEEEKAMEPLSDLAAALGMNYVFAESWAPEYGNAVLSKWPIKRWEAQKIFDYTDFRNVLKATIDVPQVGEVNFNCTHLDHLDENWRMKQINAIIQSNDGPHILAGGLNSLDESDYSSERWTNIVKYYEEIGKPTPKVEVMRFLKSKQYTDSKEFAGECEPVVMIAKGQSVQGTCKYGTRVDYIVASPNSPYKFVPGSYSVLSSKGTSDHHIVKVDVVKLADENNNNNNAQENVTRKRKQPRQKVVKITNNSSSSSKGIWKTTR